MRMLRARVVRDVVQVVALTAAAAWALYTFWYQARYVPAHETPNVVVNCSLELVAEHENFVALRARVRAHNSGKARVRLVSQSVNLVGARFAEGESAPLGFESLPEGKLSFALGSGVDGQTTSVLTSIVETVPRGSQWLEPNEAIEHTHVLRVSRHRWDVAFLDYYALFNSAHRPPPQNEQLKRAFTPRGAVVLPTSPDDADDSLGLVSTSTVAVAVLPP